MSVPTKTKTWILANKPTKAPVLSGDNPTFKLEEKDLPELKDKQILVRTKYISNDPAQRGWIDANIDPKRLYVPPVQVGDAMRARALGEVIQSRSSKFAQGSWVIGGCNWSEFAVLDEDSYGLRLTPDLPGGLSRTHYLGALGLTGLTAYCGLVLACDAKGSDKVLVSGAAGATGSMVVQIAKKIVGADRVVGIAGTDEKCKWVEGLGADKCLNYKSPTFEQDLDAQGNFDVYFDNVGGDILDLALLHMSQGGRIAACGAVSAYNTGNVWNSKNYFQVITMRLRIQGFIVTDHMSKFEEIVGIFRKALQEGKLDVANSETVVESSFAQVPETWLRLFSGDNTGKLVTSLS